MRKNSFYIGIPVAAFAIFLVLFLSPNNFGVTTQDIPDVKFAGSFIEISEVKAGSPVTIHVMVENNEDDLIQNVRIYPVVLDAALVDDIVLPLYLEIDEIPRGQETTTPLIIETSDKIIQDEIVNISLELQVNKIVTDKKHVMFEVTPQQV